MKSYFSATTYKLMKFYRKYAEIFFHLIGWLILMLLPFFLFDSGNQKFGPHIKFLQLDRMLFNLVLIFYFYLNMYFFIPKFLNKKKYMLFLLSIAGGYLMVYFADILLLAPKIGFGPAMDNPPPPEFREKFLKRPPRLNFGRVFLFLFLFTTSTIIRLFQIWQRDQKTQEIAEKERIKSELSYLKLQISPHFLYNSLNSIYSLAIENSDKTAEVVLKLSELTRYMTYTIEQKYVDLEEEIEHVTNFVDLQKLRLFAEVVVNLNHTIDNKGAKIEPMLLIPFVENAFKHGVSYSNKAEINIQLKVKNNKLDFLVTNLMFQKSDTKNSKSDSGIGLPNVKRRLELLYPDNHILNISEEENKFKVELSIDLKT